MKQSEGEIIGEIAYRYYLLRQATEKVMAIKRSPVEKMVDEATGHNPFAKGTKQVLRQARAIVRLKKVLGDDSSGEQELIKQLQEILSDIG